MTRGQGAASLQRLLLRDVLSALGLIWLLGTAVAVAIAFLFAQRAFDRSILDDAYFLGGGVTLHEGRLRLILSPGELRTVLFDQGETMAFDIRTIDGTPVAGNRVLKPPQPPYDVGYSFDDIELDGQDFRTVTLRLETPQPFVVTVAQSNRARTALLRELAGLSLALQLALLAGLAWWLRRRIRRGVAPLGELQQSVAERTAGDFSPIDVATGTREVRELASAINGLLLRLENGARAQREFTGNVAHELRTPLAGIRALAEYGLRNDTPQVWREQLEGIRQSETRASGVLDKLLALALASEARTALHLAPVRLDLAVHDAVLRFLQRADLAGVDLGAEGIDEPVTVQADLTLLEGILHNLLDNALRHGSVGGARPAVVTVSLALAPGAVRLSVQDNGPGIASDRREHLMQRGARGDSGDLQRPGGVGLALVRMYAHLLQAQVDFGPGEDGLGWRVGIVFALPAQAATQAPAQAPTPGA